MTQMFIQFRACMILFNAISLKLHDSHFDSRISSSSSKAVNELPKEWDWRTEDVIRTPILNKKRNKVCWAIQTAACIEAQENIKRKERGEAAEVILSPQSLIDECPQNKDGSLGNTARAFNCVKDNGIAYLADYLFSGKRATLEKVKGSERLSKDIERLSISDYYALDNENERNDPKLKVRDQEIVGLVRKHPIVEVLEYTPELGDMIDYTIYKEARKNDKDKIKRYVVLIMGYGEEDGSKYWIFRNSYGTWCVDGDYGRIEREMPDGRQSLFMSIFMPNRFHI
ncbi:unnamed protein product [Cuscuta epithymum]|uniref:Peptidase C1A papain C-terminal domain-containing protein n=1 Tax=Cuscuta epithymum TaxID=186058 RepID=A0AAV0DQL4_9ASTE|nr:unnamed protein product [Cuscuta epithymum]